MSRYDDQLARLAALKSADTCGSPVAKVSEGLSIEPVSLGSTVPKVSKVPIATFANAWPCTWPAIVPTEEEAGIVAAYARRKALASARAATDVDKSRQTGQGGAP